MKCQKIEAKNSDAIREAIYLVEGNSIVNCLSMSMVEKLADHAEKRLDQFGIVKKYRAGAKLYYCPAGPYAKSYKYAQGATSIMIVRKSSNWYVEDVIRTSVYPQSKERKELILTVAQKDIAVSQFCKKFRTEIPNTSGVMAGNNSPVLIQSNMTV